MNCDKCGKQLGVGEQSCQGCGNPAQTQAVSQIPIPPTPPQVPVPPQPPIAPSENPIQPPVAPTPPQAPIVANPNPATQPPTPSSQNINNAPLQNQPNAIYQEPTPKTGIKKFLPFIIGGGVLATILIIVIVAVSGGNRLAYSNLTNDPANITKTIESDGTCNESLLLFDEETYCLAQFEEYKEHVKLLKSICDIFCLENIGRDREGTIKAEVKRLYNLDMTQQADNDYFVGMYWIYHDYELTHNIFSQTKMYVNPYEARAKIQERTKQLQETWNRFLAHVDLEYEISIMGEEPFIFDGRYTGKNRGVRNYVPLYDPITDENGKEHKEIVETQPKTKDRNELEDAYAWARNYQATSPGRDGTYSHMFREFADKFGVRLDYNFNNIYEGCSVDSAMDTSMVFAAYCHATPNKIFINNEFVGLGNEARVNSITDTQFKDALDFPNIASVFNMGDVRNLFTEYPAFLKSSIYLDTMKHEMAHHLIGKHCNTPQPLIARRNRVEIEAVTNSYAVIYLGMSPHKDKFSPSEYRMSAQSDRVAKEIHNGSCN